MRLLRLTARASPQAAWQTQKAIRALILEDNLTPSRTRSLSHGPGTAREAPDAALAGPVPGAWAGLVTKKTL